MKTLKAILAMSLVATTLTLAGGVTQAATSADRTVVDSKATITLVHGEGPLAPLHIDHVTDIFFGKQPISGDTIVYNARYVEDEKVVDENGATKYIAPTVQIKDNRGTNNGWVLKVAVSDFTTEKDGKVETLAAAQLSMKPTTAYKYQNPTADVTGAKSKKIDLNATAQTIIAAEAGEGIGTSTYSFGEYSDVVSDEWAKTVRNEDVQLTVPGASAKILDATYDATLTWSIEDAP